MGYGGCSMVVRSVANSSRRRCDAETAPSAVVRTPSMKNAAGGAVAPPGPPVHPAGSHISDRCAMAPVLSPTDSAGTPMWCSIVSSRFAIGVSSG